LHSNLIIVKIALYLSIPIPYKHNKAKKRKEKKERNKKERKKERKKDRKAKQRKENQLLHWNDQRPHEI